MVCNNQTSGLSIHPGSRNLGTVTVGQSSAAYKFSFINMNTAAVTPSQISISGTNASEFAVSNNGVSSLSISAGAAATFDVVFTPNSSAAKSAALNISVSGSNITVALSGNTSDISNTTAVSISSGTYTVDNTTHTINNIPYGTSVTTFITGISTSGGTTKVYQGNGTTEVTSGNITTGMIAKVTPGTGSPVSYTLTVNSQPNSTNNGFILSASVAADKVVLEWTKSQASNTAGYFLYKGLSAGNEDITALSDFQIAGQTFTDENVEVGKTYYYICKAVTADDTIIESSNEISITAKAGNASGKLNEITLIIGNPNMKVNGVKKEIDPGRNTCPIIVNGRTVLPIRALIESIGGTVAWDAATSKITITYKTTTLMMQLNSKLIK